MYFTLKARYLKEYLKHKLYIYSHIFLLFYTGSDDFSGLHLI